MASPWITHTNQRESNPTYGNQMHTHTYTHTRTQVRTHTHTHTRMPTWDQIFLVLFTVWSMRWEILWSSTEDRNSRLVRQRNAWYGERGTTEKHHYTKIALKTTKSSSNTHTYIYTCTLVVQLTVEEFEELLPKENNCNHMKRTRCIFSHAIR